MRKLIAIAQVSLDGVMQGPGGPGEDTQGGFRHGGWAMGFDDDAVHAALGKLMGGKFDLLLGRRTYDIWRGYWPSHVDNPIGKAFAKAVKYVVTGKAEGLDWPASKRLAGKAAAAVRKLKATQGPPLHIWGSGELLQALIAADLVDEYQFWTVPVVLGYGKRFFEPGVPPRKLKLVEGKVGSAGVLVATYRPDGPLAGAKPAKPSGSGKGVKRPRRAS
jgi:dihydrofolate reductase